MPDLSNIPDHELVAELERRGSFSRFVQLLTGFFRAPAPPPPGPVVVPLQAKDTIPTEPPKFFPGTDRRLPKGTVAVEEVPGRANKDGSQLRVATISPELQKRLTATHESLRSVASDGCTGQFIVKGDDRRALAQSFIDSWEDEIRATEHRLATEVLSQEQIEDAHRLIEDLQRQIAIRRDSAFGGPTFEEVMAKNAKDNPPEEGEPARVERVESKPGTPGVGLKWDFPTGIDAIDHPQRLYWEIQERPEVLVRLKAIIPSDPCIAHLEKPVVFGESGPTTSFQILADPVVFMRLMVAIEQAYKELRVDVSKSKLLRVIWEHGQAALNDAKDNPPGPSVTGLTAVAFCREWTSYLKFRLNQIAGAGADDHTYRSIKRQIRIWNPDFREQEAPDWMFEESLPEGFVGSAVDEGSQRSTEVRPHINPNAAWQETPAGPGVFKMSPPSGRTFGRKAE